MYSKLLVAALGGLALLALSACAEDNSTDSAAAVELTTYKSATCGCCTLWAKHAEDLGFAVTARDVDNLNAVKEAHGIKPRFQSCHTSVTSDGYVFEGHIPAKLIRRFLQSPPAEARGLAVPAMPLGSPGMEYQNKFTPYRVWQLNRDGSREVYAEIASAAEQF